MSGEAGARRGARFHLAALAVAALLAVAETWPLVTVLGTHYPLQSNPATGENRGSASSDQLLTSWILASNARRLGEHPLGVFDTNNMTPFRRTLAFSENLLGMTAGIWPVQLVSDNPVLADNLALLFTLGLSAYGVILLVHELTGSRLGAVAGAVFATYAPYVWANIDQLHVTAGQTTALAWFALARLVRTRAWRWAVLLAIFTAWQVWATLHWGLFLALGLATGVPVLLVLSRDARRVLPQLVLAGLLAGLLIAPLAVPYAAVGREMGLREPTFIAFLFFPWIVLPPFGDPLGYFARLGDGVRQNASMTMAPFVAMATGLAASLVIRRPRRIPGAMMVALATAGVVNFWYACGPQRWFGLPSLFTALADVPGLGVVRAPSRALFYTDLMVAVLGGCGMGALARRVRSPLLSGALAASLVTMAVVEAGWKPAGVIAAPPRDRAVARALAALPAGCAIAELPDDFVRQGLALFRSTMHWRPLVNGRSGFYPISPFVEAGFLNQFPTAPGVSYLRAAGACAVIVHGDTPGGRAIMKTVIARGVPVRRISPTEYLVMVPQAPAAPPDGPALARSGWRVVEPADAAAAVDGSLATLAEFEVASADPLARLVVDLGKPQQVSGVDVELGSHFRHYLWTYRLEGSADGTTWSTLAESDAALPPLASYRDDPHAVVQRIRFAPSEVRFLRLGPYRPPPRGNVLTLDGGFARWGVAELTVRGVPDGSAPPPAC